MKLLAQNLSKDYTGHKVVDVPNVSLGGHGLEGLIGPNGAGKSTLMGLLTRRIAPSSGSITLENQSGSHDLMALKSHEVARKGLIKTNQRIQGFDTLSIRDNLRLAATSHNDEGLGSVFDAQRDCADIEAEIDSILHRFPFADPDGPARSGGEKKLLDILRCLLARPTMLLMDEPTAGLPDDLTAQVMELVSEAVERGQMTVVIVEHDLPMIWKYCSYVHFLSEGQLLFEGTPEDVRDNKVVAEKYMGQ